MLVYWKGADGISVPLDDNNTGTLKTDSTYNIPQSAYDLLVQQSPGDVDITSKQAPILPGVTKNMFYVPSTGEMLEDMKAVGDYISTNPNVLVVECIGLISGTLAIPPIIPVDRDAFRSEALTTTLLLADTTLELTGILAFNVNLLDPATAIGKIYSIKNSSTATITLMPFAEETIGGGSSFALLTTVACRIVSNGVHWIIL